MVTTREIKGTKQEIVDQINQFGGRILSAILLVDDVKADKFVPPSQEQLDKWMKELDELAVSGPANVDDSREAMYTRMPGE